MLVAAGLKSVRMVIAGAALPTQSGPAAWLLRRSAIIQRHPLHKGARPCMALCTCAGLSAQGLAGGHRRGLLLWHHFPVCSGDRLSQELASFKGHCYCCSWTLLGHQARKQHSRKFFAAWKGHAWKDNRQCGSLQPCIFGKEEKRFCAGRGRPVGPAHGHRQPWVKVEGCVGYKQEDEKMSKENVMMMKCTTARAGRRRPVGHKCGHPAAVGEGGGLGAAGDAAADHGHPHLPQRPLPLLLQLAARRHRAVRHQARPVRTGHAFQCHRERNSLPVSLNVHTGCAFGGRCERVYLPATVSTFGNF